MTELALQRLTIIGDGATGTLFGAVTAGNGHLSTLWGRRAEHIAALCRERENKLYLPGFPIPQQMQLTADDSAAFIGCQIILCAVPTQFIRAILKRLARHIPAGIPVTSPNNPEKLHRQTVKDCSASPEVQTRNHPEICP